MKPYDGGQWIGVNRVRDRDELERAYDESGGRLMHLQASVERFDVFARSLSIGPETMVMKFRPEMPMHDRYAVAHDFLSPELGDEVLTISRLVNAFFRWEFNSCECLVRGDQVHPIDYANASPDVALTSLHYYFPWAIKSLLKWCTFCIVTGRRPRRPRHAQLLRDRRPRGPRLRGEARGLRDLTDEYFDTDRYHDFCDSRLAHVDELVLEGGSARFRPPARRHGPLDLPGARAGPVRPASARPGLPVGPRAGAGSGFGVRMGPANQTSVPALHARYARW